MDWKKFALEQAALIKQLQARIAELEAEISAMEASSWSSKEIGTKSRIFSKRFATE